MQQCLWCHRFWNLWISQNHKNLVDILRTKHFFLQIKGFVNYTSRATLWLRQKNTFVVGVNFKVQYFFVIFDTIFTCNICILVPDMVQLNCYFWMDFLTSALHASFFGSLYSIFSVFLAFLLGIFTLQNLQIFMLFRWGEGVIFELP